MNCDLTRRKFLVGLGASASVLAVGGYTVSFFGGREVAPVTTLAYEPAFAPNGRTLVVIELGGGNDALNMVVPHANNTYYDLRPDIGIRDPLDLDGEIGLHPELAGLAARYAQGDVAVVEGVGYPNPDLSHFTSAATWWAASPGLALQTGWLGRYLDVTGGYQDPLGGITIGPGPSQAMAGATSFAVSIENASGLQPNLPDWIDDRDELIGAWAGFVPVDPATGILNEVHGTITDTLTARDTLNRSLADLPVERGNQLANKMTLAARLILSEAAPRVLYIHGIGDFDTHQNSPNRHGNLMRQLNEGIETLYAALGDQADRVTIMTTSEFGRRPSDNGSGSDHGTAAAQLLIGSGITGGRYGEAPNLRQTDASGNISATTDFRSVFATVLDDWLDVDHQDILGGTHETLGFVGQSPATASASTNDSTTG